jgi:uncharacterized protein YecT (DUF1311 family)
MKRTKLATLVLLLATSWPAAAGPDEAAVRYFSKLTQIPADDIHRDFDACDGTTVQMMTCMGYRWAVKDLVLIQVYRSARAVADDSGYGTHLVEAQRLWVRYRDASCRFEASMEAGGGSAEPLARYDCLARLTDIRVKELERIASSNAG